MKKKILILLAAIFLIILLLCFYTFIISFKVVKQNTDNINLTLKKNFQEIVRIPEPVQPSFRSFEKTVYNWEMITNEQEVTLVTFAHDTGFSRHTNKITATLEMPSGADSSLFNKVMPAVVSDSQALSSAQDLEHANLGSNETLGYNRIELLTKEDNPTQVVKIIWEFDKENIAEGTEEFYGKLYKHKESTLKALYAIQRTVLIILSP